MGQRVARFSFLDRSILALKALTLLMLLGAALSGHPPSQAQPSNPTNIFQPTPVTGEDIRQDGDIAYMKSGIDAHNTSIKDLTLIVTKQGEDIARLDTKLTFFFWVISALFGGQIGLTLLPKKER